MPPAAAIAPTASMRARELRRQRDHPRAAGQPVADLVEVRVAPERRVVDAEPVRRDERPLDVEPERGRAVDWMLQRGEGPLDRAARAGHDRRQEARHPVAREHRGGARDRGRVDGEVGVPDAIHLQLDEPRRGGESLTVERGPRPVRWPVEGLDQPIGDEDPARAAGEALDDESFSHPPSRGGARGTRRGRPAPADHGRRDRHRRRASPSARRRRDAARARSSSAMKKS